MQSQCPCKECVMTGFCGGKPLLQLLRCELFWNYLSDDDIPLEKEKSLHIAGEWKRKEWNKSSEERLKQINKALRRKIKLSNRENEGRMLIDDISLQKTEDENLEQISAVEIWIRSKDVGILRQYKIENSIQLFVIDN